MYSKPVVIPEEQHYPLSMKSHFIADHDYNIDNLFELTNWNAIVTLTIAISLQATNSQIDTISVNQAHLRN